MCFRPFVTTTSAIVPYSYNIAYPLAFYYHVCLPIRVIRESLAFVEIFIR